MTDAEHRSLRAGYLQEAAQLLAISSPAAAAFLGDARYKLLAQVEKEAPSKERDLLQREICGACGNIFLPGWSCTTSIRSHSRSTDSPRKKEPNISPSNQSFVVYDCLRCHRETAQLLQAKVRRRTGRLSRQDDAKSHPKLSKPTEENADKVSKTVNASSKQRQKARKGGLQAMLEKNKSHSSNSSGFDLMDFAM
ncbi:hypothetical protein ACN47E_005103 [Coniothyrium glycines]